MKRRQTVPTLCLTLALTGTTLAADILTVNDVNDAWGGGHPTLVGDRVLWIEDQKDIWFHDGSTERRIQAFDAGDPALDLVGAFVFGLGSGATADSVVGAWRRGADYAWVWTSTDPAPLAIDTFAANPHNPGQPMNPEGVALADGCAFMVMQANVDGNVVKNVFAIDTLTGQATNLSGTDVVIGVDRVVTSRCHAAWVYDPSAPDGSSNQPRLLQYWDGSQLTTLDEGALEMTEIALSGDQLLYVKEIFGAPQVHHLDVSNTTGRPVQLSLSRRPKLDPQTDGRNVAWSERIDNDLHEIVLWGEVPLEPVRASLAKNRTPSAFQLDGGQALWVDAGGTALHFADNRSSPVPISPGGTFNVPFLSDGNVAWYGRALLTGNDDEIQLDEGPASTFDQPSPPMRVSAGFDWDAVRLVWNRVLGATSYNVYFAETPGVTPENHASLPGGTRIENATSPLTIPGLDPEGTYFFVVTTVEAGVEGSPSAEATPRRSILVTDPGEAADDVPGDGICLTAAGRCSLRAAIEEANALADGTTVRVPPGTWPVTLPDGLTLAGHVELVGAGAGITVLEGDGTQTLLNIDPYPSEEDTRARVSGVTLRGGFQGVSNRGLLLLDRVQIDDNGGPDLYPAGAAVDSNSDLLQIVDSSIAGNTTGSHGGGLFAGGKAVLLRTELADNTAGIGGGAIYNFNAELWVVDSTIHHNSSQFQQNWAGGGIYNESAPVLVERSAFHDNVSGDTGGGIYNGSGQLWITNTTFHANAADGAGGAIFTFGAATLNHVTMHDNVASESASFHNASTITATLQNSILSNTVGADNCNSTPKIRSLGFNIDSGNSCSLDTIAGFDRINTDPLLGPLTDNGGATPTLAPLPGSPALDGVAADGCLFQNCVAADTDQRGAARPYDAEDDGTAFADIGAYEEVGTCLAGDADGDGVASCDGDCLDDDPSAWATPGEVANLRFEDRLTLSWDLPVSPGGSAEGLLYDVARSNDLLDFAGGGSCVTTGVSGTTWADPSEPGTGELFVYLLRATNSCPAGAGAWGADSSGADRAPGVCP